MDNKVVARFRDGRMLKGSTSNFSPTRDKFHITTSDGKIAEVQLVHLKAVFFVKDLAGNKAYHEAKDAAGTSGIGRKVRCEFLDGEVMVGFTQGYDPSRPGFFLTPADPKSNNQRIFVVSSATRHIKIG